MMCTSKYALKLLCNAPKSKVNNPNVLVCCGVSTVFSSSVAVAEAVVDSCIDTRDEIEGLYFRGGGIKVCIVMVKASTCLLTTAAAAKTR